MGDVRKGNSPNVRFYVELSGTVAEAQTPYLHGKGFERITVAWQKHKLRGGSIGSVCTTRFCASERKVYKAFFRNLPLFIADQLKALGALVAKTFDQACAGRPVRTRSLGPNEAHAPRAYPIMSLLEPPLKDTIERFVKSPPAPKRRATAPPAGEGPATRRATAGSLDGFVTTVTGVPVAP